MTKKAKRVVVTFFLILIIIFIFFFLSVTFIGKIIEENDEFNYINSSHWTHMPLEYSLGKGCDKEKIQRALFEIENSTNNVVYFKETDKADIEISCSQIENCYQNKTERRLLWIITIEDVCEHESGKAQITKIKGNKILKAKINFFTIPEKQDNCTETVIHEILHVFDYSHNNNPRSIMYPQEEYTYCNEEIDEEIIEDLIRKYKTQS